MKEFKDLKIAVAGTGYVGLSLAVLLAQHHQVTALDIVPEKVEMSAILSLSVTQCPVLITSSMLLVATISMEMLQLE